MIPGFFAGAAGAGGGGGGGSDPYFANVVALLHFDGTPGSEVFTDVKGHTFASLGAGNSQLSSAEKLFGPTSCSFNGSSNQEITTDTPGFSEFNMGTGDYTYEIAIYQTANNANRQPFDARQVDSSAGFGLSVYVDDGLLIVQGATNQNLSTLSLNTWYRLAFTRESGTLRSYVNGTLIASQTDTRDYTSNRLSVGTTYTGSQGFIGYIDEFRVTKDVARYTGASYTLDAGPFPDS